ncbi:transcriptional regulator [Bradyrhizobium sp. SSBR45G]|uniref:helix-turn-helix transcriptional regulator n=1 Tax=unclassified Bradyrhizobium TaxID=2631580 RepID=UPI002342BC8A|nr:MULTISPECIES: helix-turn-helix transcriptional regulator [unclassified Bradyrhizobium]GLH81591.1 transcriptional regulator [Bradyrhizobium sp. SSBR45G]GLH89003.1 transcriptional regulator [Bradyrhizobium sp. SSBR45R]
MTNAASLGAYLRDRRGKLDPTAFGLPLQRRRTPGLRREEVAQRANVSATWYTWLEQGRGGAPSADVLDRIARAMMLTEFEREHLFLLGLGRPPEVRYHAIDGISPRLQRVLDTLEYSPAFVRTATWDILAWNRAAAAVLTDYGALPEGQRNVLRMMFHDSRVRAAQSNWQAVARYVVASFRADVARAGAARDVQSLVDELCATSTEFAAMWRDNDVQGRHGDGVKLLQHPIAGPLSLEFSGFAVDGRPDLTLVIYNPATPADADKIRALLTPRPE